KQGVHLIEQLDGAEGLDEVVVGTGVAASGAIDVGAAGGQHDDFDGRRLGLVFQVATDLEAIELGHVDVEQDQLGPLLAGNLQGFFAVSRVQQVEVFGAERGSDQPPQARIIVREQHAPFGSN